MPDELQRHFWWIGGLLARPLSGVFATASPERAVIERLRQEWGRRDTAQLLRELTDDFGELAGRAVERLLEVGISEDWAVVGAREAHEGTEVEDFIRVLWEPLRELGFAFTIDRDGAAASFCVTTCPIYDLAEETRLHTWLYHLACSTDPHCARAFSPRLGFARTETLMLGGVCCDHRYYRLA